MKRAGPVLPPSDEPSKRVKAERAALLKQVLDYQSDSIAQGDALKEIEFSVLIADVKLQIANDDLDDAPNDARAIEAQREAKERALVAQRELRGLQRQAEYDRRKAEHDQKVAELKRDITDAEAKIDNVSLSESRRNAAEADWVESRKRLNDLKWDEAAERADIAINMYPEPVSKIDVLQTLRFKSPTVLIDERATLELIETPEYHTIKGVLQRMAGEVYPTSQARSFEIGLVRGPMGVGKTFTTWEAASSISGVTPCYLRLDVFLERLPAAADPSLDPESVLAGALAYVFSDSQIRSVNLNLDEVISKIQQDLTLGKSKLILHVDEFQVAPSVMGKLVSGCSHTLIMNFGIAVIPVASGVSGVLDTDVSVKVTNWTETPVGIRALPRDALELAAAGALKIPVDVVRDSKNIQVMFNDCGDQAHLIVAVIRAIRAEDDVWQRLKSDRKFEDKSAIGVFQKALANISSVYGNERWHRLVRASCRGTDPTMRESWSRVTLKLIRKILWLALSKTAFPAKASLLDDKEKISLEQCQDAGMLSLEASVTSENEVVVAIPLMALVVMNQVGQILPSSIQLENPFGADWETLERVAMACLMVQLRADTLAVPLDALRPGASLFAELDVTVNIPQRLAFYYLGTYIEADRLFRGKKAEGCVAELKIGDVMISARNQFAHDGIAILEGHVEGSSRPILWFSQSKSVDGIDKPTGERSASTLQNGSIQSTILPKMRQGAAQFKAKFPQFNSAFVVYDVFSDREPPKRNKGNGGVELESNEALFVTRSDTLPTVLGGLAARKREIPKL